MKKFIFLCLISFVLLAQEDQKPTTSQVLAVNMDQVCREFQTQYNDQPSICLRDKSEPEVKIVNMNSDKNKETKWSIRLYFGFTRSNYLPTDLKLKTSRYDVVIKDFDFAERTTAEFYNPKNWNQFQDAFRWIDEPTNTATLVFEKGNNTFFLRAYHPKFLKENTSFEADPNREYLVEGTINGNPVSKYMPLDNNSYDDFMTNPDKDRLHIVGFSNTHLQEEFSIGYGRKINFAQLGKFGSLSFTPEVAVGVMVGSTRMTERKEGKYWEYNHSEDKLGYQGVGYSVSGKIEWRKGWFSVFGDVRFHQYRLKNEVLGGSLNYTLPVVARTIGIGINLYKKKK